MFFLKEVHLCIFYSSILFFFFLPLTKLPIVCFIVYFCLSGLGCIYSWSKFLDSGPWNWHSSSLKIGDTNESAERILTSWWPSWCVCGGGVTQHAALGKHFLKILFFLICIFKITVTKSNVTSNDIIGGSIWFWGIVISVHVMQRVV